MSVVPLTTKSEIEAEIMRIASSYPDARSIVIFAPSLAWSGKMFQRPQQLARALARVGALVFYVQPERSWPAWFTEIEPRLVLCQTPLDVFHVLPEAFVYTLPWNLSLLAYFINPRVIYDYLDDLSVFQGGSQLLQMHRKYLHKAEIVIASAWQLLEEVQTLRSDVLWIPNAADVNHFFLGKRPIPPADLKPLLDIGKPILGYQGALAHWFDYDLVQSIARARRDISIVLIGPDYDSSIRRHSLLEEPNIHWLGAKSYEELPAYVSHFDIGCIPFVVNRITNATSPIKLFEYFAAGKPVIISPMQESMRYQYVLIAGNTDEWVRHIDEALQKASDQSFRQALQQYAAKNRWEDRAERLLERIQAMPPHQARRLWPNVALRRKMHRIMPLLYKAIEITRLTGFRGLLKSIYYKSYDFWSARITKILDLFFSDWKDGYILEDNSQVTLYTDRVDLFPGYKKRKPLSQTGRPSVQVAVISTCKNEEANAAQWIAQLAEQTVKPSEVIIVDGGSTDNTVQVLKAAAQKYSLPIKVIEQAGVNIAAGRNIAVRQASSSVIASLDFGCHPYPDWLEKLIMPFQADPSTEIVAGWYQAIDPNGQKSKFPGWPQLEQISPQDFIPSSRSLAFTKEAWAKIGGYPEWLTLTGEDTYFALEGKRLCRNWAFVPEAVVRWEAPRSWSEFWEKARSWAIGNGEIGYKARLFWRLLLRVIWCSIFLLIGLVGLGTLFWVGLQGTKWALWLGISLALGACIGLATLSWVKWGDPFYVPGILGLNFAQVMGFWIGTRRRNEVTLRRLREAKGVFFLLAGAPLTDTGGGSRPAQLALELLKHGYWVVYINRYPSYETQRVHVPIAHPNLFQIELPHFNWNQFANSYALPLASLPKVALIEFPSADFLPLISSIRNIGGKIVYEMIDDWDTALGARWYSPAIERKIIQDSNVLIGTAPSLQDKLTRIGGKPAHLLPNAVNRHLFDPERDYPRPVDLPEAEWSAIYIGALWGEWFDWELLVALARRYPRASVVVIGDYRGQCPNPPVNLKFLGLRAQRQLPAYLAHTNVAIIPWKVTPITQATSPLKVYEYLAMYRPVVAPDLVPLRGIPGVLTARHPEEFLQLVDQARTVTLDKEAIETFIRKNDWTARVEQLLEWLSD